MDRPQCPECGVLRPTTPCRRCQRIARQRARRRTRDEQAPVGARQCKHCTRWVHGGAVRCDQHQEQHRVDSRRRKKEARDRRLPRAVREELLSAVEDGAQLGEVLDELGVTPQALWVWARADGWLADLDDALIMGRNPSLPHGQKDGYYSGCRCPECREYKARERGGQA